MLGLSLTVALGMTTVPAAADKAPKGTPPMAAKAYKAMGCRYGSVIRSSGSQPKYRGVTCHTVRRGEFTLRVYRNGERGKDYWLSYWFGGEPGNYIAKKGRMIVLSYKKPYGYGPTRWAADRFDGRVLSN